MLRLMPMPRYMIQNYRPTAGIASPDFSTSSTRLGTFAREGRGHRVKIWGLQNPTDPDRKNQTEDVILQRDGIDVGE
jgi:hypothetical protein